MCACSPGCGKADRGLILLMAALRIVFTPVAQNKSRRLRQHRQYRLRPYGSVPQAVPINLTKPR
jgi:hypothetical protein